MGDHIGDPVVAHGGKFFIQLLTAGDDGPALAGGLALAVLAGVAARWRKEPDAVPLPSETGDAPLDAYEQRLLDEIDS